MERCTATRAVEHAAEIALPLSPQREPAREPSGGSPCLAAAELAERAAAFADASSTSCGSRSSCLPAAARRRRAALRRDSGLALVWALHFDDGVAAARDAARQIAEAERSDAAADYLARSDHAAGRYGAFVHHGSRSRHQGLEYIGERRDVDLGAPQGGRHLRARGRRPGLGDHPQHAGAREVAITRTYAGSDTHSGLWAGHGFLAVGVASQDVSTPQRSTSCGRVSW